MKNYLQNLSNFCQSLQEYTKTKSTRNVRVRSLNYYQSCWIKSCKSHPSISVISVFLKG